MIKKESEKKKAITLRKHGKTYSEILRLVPVAKSTLSLWLRSVGLAKAEKQRITEKKLLSAKRGGDAKRKQRIERSERIFSETIEDIGKLSTRELFLIGVALYWAEGTKQKEHNVSQKMSFGNSDPNMIQLFLYWLELIRVQSCDVVFELYIHKGANYKGAVLFWSNIIKRPVSVFDGNVYFKKGNLLTPRKNVGEKYYGLVRVSVKRSTDLNRKVQGWTRGIIKSMKV